MKLEIKFSATRKIDKSKTQASLSPKPDNLDKVLTNTD